MVKRILIAGCGYVGSALAEQSLALGWKVFGLKRTATGLPDGVVPILADLTQPASLLNLPLVDYVAYTAAAGDKSESAYERIYVQGVTNLLEALGTLAAMPSALVYTSSTGVYGQDDGSWVDEASTTEPKSLSGRKMLEGERAFLQAAETRGCVLRLGGIYGPGRTRMINLVRSGQVPFDELIFEYTNRIHLDDCVGAILHLLQLNQRESVYVGCDREPVDRFSLVRWLAAEMGIPVPAHSRSQGEKPQKNKRCRSDLLVQSGYLFKYPTYREGFRAILRGEELDM